MKTVLLAALILLVSCSRNNDKPLTPILDASQGNTNTFLQLAQAKPMYAQLSTHLDLSTLTKIAGAEGVTIFMVRYKGDPTKIYAVNSKGSDLLYAAKMTDDKNGSIGLLKNGEALVIEFTAGVKVVRDLNTNEFEARFANKLHGGSGFCQRESGETFGSCFKAESDEFCDSFISCVALATQPSVAVIIGLACSCNAETSVA